MAVSYGPDDMCSGRVGFKGAVSVDTGEGVERAFAFV